MVIGLLVDWFIGVLVIGGLGIGVLVIGDWWIGGLVIGDGDGGLVDFYPP